MSAATPHGTRSPYYFVPAPSRYPVMAALGLLLRHLRRRPVGQRRRLGRRAWCSPASLFWAVDAVSWFREAIGESEGGLYSDRVDVSFRWSMSWFIFSEVMFFGAFFGALYWARAVFGAEARRPRQRSSCGPTSRRSGRARAGHTASPAGIVEPFPTIGPWPIPTINTALLLTSGVTLTIAHHALIAGQRAQDDRLDVDHGRCWASLFIGVAGLRVHPRLHAT